MLGNARAPFKPAHINTLFAYMGGGFGGRDHTPFPLYVALAAIFLPGRPVRLAHDRYQQFQGGIKRHAFKMRTRIGVDRATGKISGFAADHVLDGGGLANFSASVAIVGAVAAHRHLRHSEGRCHHGRAAFARRHRRVDARLRNAADDDRAGGADRRGGGGVAARPDRVPAAQRAQDRRQDHDRKSHTVFRSARRRFWTSSRSIRSGSNAAKRKRAGSRAGSSSAPASLAPPRITAPARTARWAAVEIDPQGRIAIHGDHVDMGNGIGTALANRVAAYLGGVADEVTVHDVDSLWRRLRSSPRATPTR